MYRNWILSSIITLLFGASTGFVAGYAVAPRDLAKEAELALRESKLADAEQGLKIDREIVDARVISVKETFADDTYSCVPAADDGRGTVRATCKDTEGKVVARVEQRFDDHPTNQGIVESVDIVLTVAGQDKRYPTKKFWNEYRSPSCAFTYLAGAEGGGLDGTVECVANDRDGGARLTYMFDAAKESMKLLYDCTSQTKVSGDTPIIAKTTETCKNYAEAQ